MRSLIEASHKLMTHVKQHHSIGEECSLDCVAKEHEAVVNQVLPEELRPRDDVSLSEGGDESEDGGLNCKLEEDGNHSLEEEVALHYRQFSLRQGLMIIEA